jgi:signal transduction histidine kinase
MMKHNETAHAGATAPAGAGEALPRARDTARRLLGSWMTGLVVFGYLPAFTYGWLSWLLNEHQWAWTYAMYFTLVPLIGGCCAILLPWLWYRPIHRAHAAWAAGAVVDPAACRRVYGAALGLPWRMAMVSLGAAAAGYTIGTAVVHWQGRQPWIEILKTVPAIPLVGGMMGAFGYFSTSRVLHPTVSWCSRQLEDARAPRQVPLALKFLTVTCILVVATLCLLQPAAHTLGQVITELHLKERGLGGLREAVERARAAPTDKQRTAALHEAALGAHGYVFAIDGEGRILEGHPRRYTLLAQERFYRVAERMRGSSGAWVDRVGQHRVVCFVRHPGSPTTYLSVTFPVDFAVPLRHFVQFSWVAMLEVLCVVIVFGRYFTKGITIPLRELMGAAERVRDHGDLDQRVPVASNDELGEVARTFNRMVGELQASRVRVQEYTARLERSAQELSVLNQEMEDLLRVVSHDLRAPLINIQGFAKRLEPLVQETVQTLGRLASARQQDGLAQEVASLRERVEPRVEESVRFIGKAVEKMDALLASLLAISRVGRRADPIEPHDLDRILDDVLATFAHTLQERAIRVLRRPLPGTVPCRRNEINQVLSNLIDNAIAYMGAVDRRFIEIGGEVRGQQALCYVRDTGVGIAPEDHERVFQMFTRLGTVDAPGEGVGLTYVRRILRSHGGRVWVESQRGQGSTFWFSLPLAPAPAPKGA